MPNDKKKQFKAVKERIIQFDSCTALMNAQARFLHSKRFFDVGVTEKNMPPWVGSAINILPKKIRKILYSWSGWMDAIPAKDLDSLESEDISNWVTSLFPKKKFNGIMFGSANGAAIHICSALGIPWLPQTYLVAPKRLLKPDEIKEDIEWGKKVIRPFLDRNTDMMTTQMHDPVQDRLMIQKMGYFRIKKMKLGNCFEEFIRTRLADDYPLITVECQYQWHQYQSGDRHLFQLGGFGAMTPEEYLYGGKRVEEFLSKVKAPVKKWEAYDPSGEFPEGEWGFTEQVLEDIRRFANSEKIPLKRLIFDHPEGLSEFTADLYRWWYKKRGLKQERLLIENFGLIAPYDAIETSSIPFWLAFNTQPSCQRIKEYLNESPKFQELYLMLMSNGVTEGIGLTTIEEWREILNYAQQRGEFIGVNEREYPLDFGTFLKYDDELLTKITERNPLPDPLSLNEFEDFVTQTRGTYPFEWLTENY